MKVVLINNISFGLGLRTILKKVTLNKVYETLPKPTTLFENMYLIKNDTGEEIHLKKSRFIPLAEYRNIKIDEILDL